MNHYEVLGIEKTATPAEIKKAYKRMAKKHHPDRVPEDQRVAAHQQMVLVNKAYDTLMDPAKREHYDLTGEEKPLTALDIEARNSILQIFGTLITAGKINVPQQATRIAKEAHAKLTRELAEHRTQYAKMEKRRDEVSCTDAENLWLRLVDSMLQQGRGAIISIERKLEIALRVTEMLKAYRSGVVESGWQSGAPLNVQSLSELARAFNEATRR